MRQIKKLQLDGAVEKQLKQKQKNINDSSTQTKFRLTSNQRAEITNKLLASQKYLCCYCECSINSNDIHIEHFYEQSDRPNLIYDYSNNLLLSCEGDRQKINDPETDVEKEERISNISCGHNKGETYHNNVPVDYDLLLNPTNDNSTLLFYNDVGEIESKSKDQSEIDKVVYANKRLNLGSTKLKNRRIEKIEEVNNQIIDEAMSLEEQKQFIASLLNEDKLELPSYFSTIKDIFGFKIAN